jgi:GTP cyclohydrolase I
MTQVKKDMPDVAEKPLLEALGTLDWVGMGGIEAPISIQTPKGIIHPLARIDAFVNLADTYRKGIHMSRLYIALDKSISQGVMTLARVEELLKEFLKSHEGISNAARLVFRFDYHKRRNALLSDNSGWKNYPSEMTATLDEKGFRVKLQTVITYSSTCPCSAALSRQLIQEKFKTDFAGKALDFEAIADWVSLTTSINATPHSQRSTATIQVCVNEAHKQDFFMISDLIEDVEAILGTPVQTAVKREDEQEFARLNAANLMFCEDSARKIKSVLTHPSQAARFNRYWVKICHMESLHPHDAVAMVGSYEPD